MKRLAHRRLILPNSQLTLVIFAASTVDPRSPKVKLVARFKLKGSRVPPYPTLDLNIVRHCLEDSKQSDEVRPDCSDRKETTGA
jgi:hypothetical protein